MATRCATITCVDDTPQLVHYRHWDGYPEGHGTDLAQLVQLCCDDGSLDAFSYVDGMAEMSCELEPNATEHGDIEYLYRVDVTTAGHTIPLISIWACSGKTYRQTMSETPLFRGTPDGLLARFGRNGAQSQTNRDAVGQGADEAAQATRNNLIYVVDTFSRISDDYRDPAFPTSGQRCVGWFPTFEDAEEAVLGNMGDIYECGSYRYAQIEPVTAGMYGSEPWDRVWYEWSDGTDGERPGYRKTEIPGHLETFDVCGIG
jgi:hypothetical protein